MRRLRSIAGSKTAGQVCLVGILLIPLLMLVPGWEGFAFSPRSNYSDLVISHYPNAQFLLNALRQGQFPLWSPQLFSGFPFAADPLAGIWYPFGWLAYWLPLPFGFNLNILLHMGWSGVGMWLFLRSQGLADLPALAGALAWELLPKTFAHFGAGHLSLVYAIAWTPWLLLAEQQLDSHKFRLAPGLVLGLLTLADVRWAAYAGLLWLAFSVGRRLGPARPGFSNLFAEMIRWAKSMGANVLLAGLIAAPQLVPLAEYSRLSTRTGMTAADNLALSLDPLRLFGLVAPDFQGYAEWSVYLGALPLLAMLWGLTYRSLRRQVGGWLWVPLLAVLFSLGENFPLNAWLARLPVMDLLRVPSRFLILTGFAGAVILARFIQSDLKDEAKGAAFWANLSTFGVAAFTWVIVLGLWAITGSPTLAYLWGAVSLTAGVALMLLKKSGRLGPLGFVTGMVLLLVLDLGSVAQSNFYYRKAAEVLSERAAVARLIQTQPGLFRVYSPSYSLPQQTTAALGLETVHGIDPLQLRSYVSFMQAAAGISTPGYSVTFPPFNTLDLASSNRAALPDAGLLGLLNVRFVAADYPVLADGLQEWQQLDGVYIYQNAYWRPRAWVQPGEGLDQSWRAAQLLESSPNRMLVEAEGPGDLVFAEVQYPGWLVRVDGFPAPWQTAYDLLRAVRLDAGIHRVEMEFQPLSVWLGVILGAAAWAAVGLAGWQARERRQR